MEAGSENDKLRKIVDNYVKADSSPTQHLSRDERNRLAKEGELEKLSEYGRSPYRSNKIGHALFAAEVLAEDMNNQDLVARIRNARAEILESGSDLGKPVSPEQVLKIKGLLAELR